MKAISLLFSIFTTILQLQATAATDSLIQFHSVSGQLHNRSDKLSNGCYYTYLQFYMAKGDMVHFTYSSKDFSTAFYVRDSTGRVSGKEDDAPFYKNVGSQLVIPFRAEQAGPYYFIFSTKTPAATGAFTVDLFYYNKRPDSITTRHSFCEKLQYLLLHNPVAFEFIRENRARDALVDRYVPAVMLDTASANEIIRNPTYQLYRTSWPPSENLAQLQQQYRYLQQRIISCLPKARQKSFTAAELSASEKASFIARTDFTESGSILGDLHTHHKIEKIKYRISLRLVRLAERYQLSMDIY